MPKKIQKRELSSEETKKVGGGFGFIGAFVANKIIGNKKSKEVKTTGVIPSLITDKIINSEEEK